MICKKAKEELKKVNIKLKTIRKEDKYWDAGICPNCGYKEQIFMNSLWTINSMSLQKKCPKCQYEMKDYDF